jgi:cell division protease FtsH
VVDAPDVHGRAEILGLYAKKAPISPNADLFRLAQQTPGFTGADLANIMNEAALLAVRANKSTIEQPELEEAVDRVLSGPARKSHLLTKEELWRIAIHESGHAIVSNAIGNSAALQKVSVVARGRGRGGGTVYASEDKLLLTHLDLVKNLVTSMAGVAAEQYVFGTLSTGGEGDLADATNVAHAMVAVYGMSDAIGPIAIGGASTTSFVGVTDSSKAGHVSAATQELVDAETTRLVRDAETTAVNVLESNASVLEDLANALVVQETLSGPSLDVYLEAVKPWSEPLVRGSDPKQIPIRLRGDGPASSSHDDTVVFS